MLRTSLIGVGIMLLLPRISFAQYDYAMVKNATSAAPASVSSYARVLDWEQNVLRDGANGWTCLPDPPDQPGNSPMCLDGQFMRFLVAMLEGSTPEYDRIGFGYMLQGGAPASRTNPAAKGPEDAEDWMEEPGPPHLMMVVPDPAMLKGLTTSPRSGGPWVMWKGTPLVHVMIPSTKAPDSK